MLFLVVDDQQAIRHLLKEEIQSYYPQGFVITCSGGYQAREILQKTADRVCAVISDFQMPEGDGHVVFEAWRNYSSHVPFILYSSEVRTGRTRILESYKGPRERLAFIEKTSGAESYLRALERIFPKSYVSLPLNYLNHVEFSKVPLYVKVNEQKFLKFFNPEEPLDKDRLGGFEKKGGRFLYISSPDYTGNKCASPLFPVLKRKEKEVSLSDSFENFKRVYKTLLTTSGLNSEKMDGAIKILSKDISHLSDSQLGQWFSQKKFSLKNYTCDHSFLIAVMTFMGLAEMKLANPYNRQLTLFCSLIHDLFRKDIDALERDLNDSFKEDSQKDSLLTKNPYLIQLIDLIKDWELSQDYVTCLEAMVLGLHNENYTPRGQHKIANLLLSMHHLSTELYQTKFAPGAIESFALARGNHSSKNFTSLLV